MEYSALRKRIVIKRKARAFSFHNNYPCKKQPHKRPNLISGNYFDTLHFECGHLTSFLNNQQCSFLPVSSYQGQSDISFVLDSNDYIRRCLFFHQILGGTEATKEVTLELEIYTMLKHFGFQYATTASLFDCIYLLEFILFRFVVYFLTTVQNTEPRPQRISFSHFVSHITLGYSSPWRIYLIQILRNGKRILEETLDTKNELNLVEKIADKIKEETLQFSSDQVAETERRYQEDYDYYLLHQDNLTRNMNVADYIKFHKELKPIPTSVFTRWLCLRCEYNSAKFPFSFTKRSLEIFKYTFVLILRKIFIDIIRSKEATSTPMNLEVNDIIGEIKILSNF